MIFLTRHTKKLENLATLLLVNKYHDWAMIGALATLYRILRKT